MHVKRGGLRSVRTLLRCTMSSIFDQEVRRLGMRDPLKHGTITVSGFGYFHKNCRFLLGKNVSKTNLGSTIHYTYTSYNKYFRLRMVSEELRFNEIGLFLQYYRYRSYLFYTVKENNLIFFEVNICLNLLIFKTYFLINFSPWESVYIFVITYRRVNHCKK